MSRWSKWMIAIVGAAFPEVVLWGDVMDKVFEAMVKTGFWSPS